MTRASVVSSGKQDVFTGCRDDIVLTESAGTQGRSLKPNSWPIVALIGLATLLIAFSFGFFAITASIYSSSRSCHDHLASETVSVTTKEKGHLKEGIPVFGASHAEPYSMNKEKTVEKKKPFLYHMKYEDWMKKPVAADDGKKAFSFDDMYDGSLVPKSPRVQWVGDNELTYLNDYMELVLHNVDTDVEEVIMPNDTFIEYNPSFYRLSPDRQFVVIDYDVVTEIQDAYLYANHKVYNLEKQTLLDFPNDKSMVKKVMFNTWTPKGHGLTFVYDEDLYYQADPYAKPERLTTSGAIDGVRNGHSFWNYLGVLQASAAVWWSPDMSYLAYGEFNSTSVEVSKHPVYVRKLYPRTFEQVYLKAGDAEHFSYSQIHIINMTDEARSRITVPPPRELKDQHHYYYKLMWQNDEEFAMGWTDRRQKRSIVGFCSVAPLLCRTNHDMTVQKGWFDGAHLIRFIDHGTSYLAILYKYVEAKDDSFRQVAMVNSLTGEVTYLTSDDNDVISINDYDSERHLIYYTGNNKNQLQQHVFRVGTPDADPSLRVLVCMTCDEGANCGSASATFSSTTDYYILGCLGPDVPYYHLRWTHDLTKSYTLKDNADVKERLATRNLPTKEFHELNIGDGYTGWAEFILPPGMVKDGSVKYPVMFYPYAGPHGHTQGNYQYKGYSAAGGLWDYFLASSENIIVVRLNGRGSGMKGEDFLFTVYRRLGELETKDQIEGAKSMIAKYPYVDGDRMAIWGWSYGGFTSSQVMADPSDVFKCGIAVAPVTNFRNYYAAYTERYMDLDTPDDNSGGYNFTDVTRRVEHFKNKKYLIAHGSLDDNVFFQHAMEMIRALSNAQILFKTQVYVDQSHSISDYPANRHLLLSITDFYLNDCLGKQSPAV